VDGDLHERAPRLAVVLAALWAAGHAAAGCTCAGQNDDLARVKQDVKASLGRALDLTIESITCPRGSDPAALECLVKARGHDSFIIEISSVGDAGALGWKPRGHKNMEYQLALGMIEQVRNRPERVVCPEAGNLAQGFECQVDFTGGVTTAVAVSAGERDDRFAWAARSILMPGVIEARIAEDAAAEGKQATVSCGSELRQIVPGSSFECAISYTGGSGSGGEAAAEVSIIDDAGHVQYRLRSGASVSAP
jgi:hypothetical protein